MMLLQFGLVQMDDIIESICYSPGGKLIASCSDDETIKLWEISSGENIKTLEGHTDCVIAVSFSPDGKTLASGSDDGIIKLWDVTTGKNIRNLRGHTGYIWSLCFISGLFASVRMEVELFPPQETTP